MNPTEGDEERIAKTLEEIFDLQLEALRRAGVAQEKEQGLEIESTEALRLFREATGYLLRLRELRGDIQAELHYNDHYNASHVLGHLDDYNRILDDIRDNPSFQSCIGSFEGAEYELQSRQGRYRVSIEGRSHHIDSMHNQRHRPAQSNVPMDGSEVETFVLPRLIRVTKDVESSIIGRCASGKRP